MYDESDKLFDKKFQEKDILKDITDLKIKERFKELRRLEIERNERDAETGGYSRVPNSFRRSIQELFSQKDPYILRYLLFNIDYLREFSPREIGYGALDSVFRAITNAFNILRLYKLFSGLPKYIFDYFANKFGRRNNYYINKYISLNIIQSKEPGINSSFDYWNVKIFVCKTLLEEIPTFYKTDYYKSEAVLELENLKTVLEKWIKGNFDVKLLSRSLAIPILEKLRDLHIPNITSILQKYSTRGEVFVETTPSQLAEKKITVYEGEVISIKHFSKEVIKSEPYKGIVTQGAKTKIILKNVLIIPSFKEPHELSKDDVEFKIDRLEAYTFPNNFKENPFEIGDKLYCYGKVDRGIFDIVWGGGYDVLKFKSLKDYQINEYLTLKRFNDRVSYIYIRGENVAKLYSEKNFDDTVSKIQEWVNNNYLSKTIPSRIFFPVLKKLSEIDHLNFLNLIREEFIRRFSETHGQERTELLWFLPKNRELFTKEELRYFKFNR